MTLAEEFEQVSLYYGVFGDNIYCCETIESGTGVDVGAQNAAVLISALSHLDIIRRKYLEAGYPEEAGEILDVFRELRMVPVGRLIPEKSKSYLEWLGVFNYLFGDDGEMGGEARVIIDDVLSLHPDLSESDPIIMADHYDRALRDLSREFSNDLELLRQDTGVYALVPA